MAKERQVILAAFSILICLVIIILLGTHVPDPRGQFQIEGNTVSGNVACKHFSVVLGAEIYGAEVTELSAGKGTGLEYRSRRVAVLQSIYSGIEGIIALGEEQEEFLIKSLGDLEAYVEKTQEDLAFCEKYSRDGIELTINHRDNIITYRLPREGIVSLQEQLSILREFAVALNIETSFNFDDPKVNDDCTIVPVRVDGLPLVAASRDFLLDEDEELWVMFFQGYDLLHMGLSARVTGKEIVVKSINTILPAADNAEKKRIISVEEAVESLKRNLGSIYIDGKYADQHYYAIQEIRLAYCAVYKGGGEYDLEPVWVFIDAEDLAWDYCFFVNAHTGEVYPAISDRYYKELNRPG